MHRNPPQVRNRQKFPCLTKHICKLHTVNMLTVERLFSPKSENKSKMYILTTRIQHSAKNFS